MLAGVRRFAPAALASSLILMPIAALAGDAGAPPDPAPVIAAPCSSTDLRCERARFAVSKEERIAGDFDYDSGWLPAGSALQVRLLSYLYGRTRVDLGGALDATWPDAISLRPNGVPTTGVLAIDDSFVVKAQGRFHVTVAGKDYDWSGDLPGLPSVDLEAKATTVFDPWAWQGVGAAPSVSAKSGKITLAKVPLTDAIIPIPGISGGFDLDGEGEFSASYDTVRIAFDELVAKGTVDDVTATFPTTRELIADAPSLDTTLFIHGELTRAVTLHFIPGFYFELLGKKFEMPILDAPVPLPPQRVDWSFDPVAVHVPLPRIEVRPREIQLGKIPVGTETSITATVFDTGEERLVVDASDSSGVATVLTKNLVIPGGSSDALHATLTPTAEGAIDTVILLASNDPRSPSTRLRVRATAVLGAPPVADDGAGTQAAGSCGCRVGEDARGGGGIVGLVGVAVVLGVLRRRRARRE